MNLLLLWNQIQAQIKEEVGSAAYETWFSALEVAEKTPGLLAIYTPDEFFKNWIVDHYASLIEDKISALANEPVKLAFDVYDYASSQTSAAAAPQDNTALVTDTTKDSAKLNARFSFNNFVVGPSNRFAYAACMAVAESPAKAYNPLFIYGQVGLGKTHLLQAITQQIKNNHPNIKTCYISSEKFTNELIDAIQHRSTSRFRQKYREIDVLLIDDIHFIAGKESTQEEFFHTFNTLHNNRKQIIISSDRPPKEIANLEERLSSRFAWGLITDIQPPDFETRVAILRKKSEREPIEVPDNVINYIAEQIMTNIRELEGALIRVVAYSLLEDKPVSLDMAKLILKDMVQETRRSVNINTIQKTVADFFQITLTDLKASKRSQNLILPRQVAMYLARKMTTLSLPEIGRAFGGKDHTTVLHSCKKIEKTILTDHKLKNTLEKIITRIK